MEDSFARDHPVYWIGRDPLDMLKWLARVDSGEVDGPTDYQWWLAMATAAGHVARRELNREWAHVAVWAYQRATDLLNDGDTESLEQSAMMLRAYMISRLGSVTGDPTLDANIILSWFDERTSRTPEQAEALIAPLDTLTTDQLKQLRRIKNRLAVIDVLVSGQSPTLAGDFDRWLSIRRRLP